MQSIPIFGSEANIPEQVGRLSYQKVVYYPDPRLGVSISYGAENAPTAHVYLYDPGSNISSANLESPEVAEAFDGARKDICKAAAEGLYQEFTQHDSQLLRLSDTGEAFCWWASFSYQYPPEHSIRSNMLNEDRLSHLALWVDRGQINKIRYTYSKNAGKLGFLAFLTFVAEWRSFVKGVV